MGSQLRKNHSYNLTYSIPRFEVGVPGRQDRSSSVIFRISPGASEPFEFHWGDMNGIPINMVGFRAVLVIWKGTSIGQEEFNLNPDLASVVLSKEIEVMDPHSGGGAVLLNADDTMKIWTEAREGSLRWGVILLNENKDVFPLSVSANSRSGIVVVDPIDTMPIGEFLKNL